MSEPSEAVRRELAPEGEARPSADAPDAATASRPSSGDLFWRPLTRQQSGLVFLTALALMLVSGIVLISSLLEVFDRAEAYADSLERITEIERLRSTLVDAEAGQQAFVITGDFDDLEPYQTSITQLGAQIDALREIVSDNPRQQEAYARLQQLVARKLAQLERAIDVRNRQGLEAARVLLIEGDERLVMDEIREVIATLRGSEFGEAEVERRQTESDRWVAVGSVFMLAALAMAMLVMAWFFVRRDQRTYRAVGSALEREVQVRTAELVVANERLVGEVREREAAEAKIALYSQELERSNRELNDFAFVASHDLQEPLRKIRAFGDRLAGDFAEPLGEQGRDYLHRMQSAAQRMSTLINDLLTFSRVNTRGKPFEPVALDEVLETVVDDLEIRIRESGARLSLVPLPTLDADPTQMRQLLQNLLGNALKFSRPNVPPHVELSVESIELDGEPAWRIVVKDNGIGFDEKYLDRIFTPFQRLHTRTAYGGTGIGLAICRRIVERHRGHLTARSEEGLGASFVVELLATQENHPLGELENA